MKRRLLALRFLGEGQDGLILLTVLLLLVFTYGARADLLGTSGAGRSFAQVSGRPVLTIVHFLAAGILLGVLPVLSARKLAHKSCRDLGLGLGNPRRGLFWLSIGIPLAVLAGKIASGSPAMQSVYPLDPSLTADPSRFGSHAVLGFLYYGSWEVLFRGVLLFGLKDRLGAGPANVLQTALSVTAHFGRPLDETFAAVPAGLVFGKINLHTGSIWAVAVIHWVVGMSTDWFILQGGR